MAARRLIPDRSPATEDGPAAQEVGAGLPREHAADGSSPPFLEVCGVTKRFGPVTALRDVSFAVARGELHALCGENGAGKSTLMKILSGVLRDYEGEFRLKGRVQRFASVREAQAAGVSIIHQELQLVEQLSAAANLHLGREPRTRWGWLDERAMDRSAREVFAQLDCEIPPRALVSRLRIGDQQLVEIAKALLLSSEVLIMDEPTSALTNAEAERLFRVMERLRRQSVTIVYISHKMDEIFQLADRITVLRDGCVVRTLRRKDASPREIAHLMVGRDLETRAPRVRPPAGDAVLHVEGLSLDWPGGPGRPRLEDVSFTLHRGEVLGLAGLMGAGRTELLECLFGAAPARQRGRVELAGRSVHFRHPAEALAAGVAMVSEDRKRLGLLPQRTVRDNITLCTLAEFRRAGLLSAARERRAAQESCERLGVRAAGVEAPIMSLSGGNQQKCLIARWLRTRPQVLLLDDPTRGVDVGAKAELYEIIETLCSEGLGILLTSSELPELLALCDRVLVLCEGRVTGELSRGEFSEPRIMELATRRAAAEVAAPSLRRPAN